MLAEIREEVIPGGDRQEPSMNLPVMMLQGSEFSPQRNLFPKSQSATRRHPARERDRRTIPHHSRAVH